MCGYCIESFFLDILVQEWGAKRLVKEDKLQDFWLMIMMF